MGVFLMSNCARHPDHSRLLCAYHSATRKSGSLSVVPDKVTLTEGDKVVWLNHDNSEHRITVGSDSRSGYQLLNSLVLQNGTIEHQFQLAGTYYSVLDDPGSRGTVTILDKGNEDNAVSIPSED